MPGETRRPRTAAPGRPDHMQGSGTSPTTPAGRRVQGHHPAAGRRPGAGRGGERTGQRARAGGQGGGDRGPRFHPRGLGRLPARARDSCRSASRGGCPARPTRGATSSSTGPPPSRCTRTRSRPGSGCSSSTTCWPPAARPRRPPDLVRQRRGGGRRRSRSSWNCTFLGGRAELPPGNLRSLRGGLTASVSGPAVPPPGRRNGAGIADWCARALCPGGGNQGPLGQAPIEWVSWRITGAQVAGDVAMTGRAGADVTSSAPGQQDLPAARGRRRGGADAAARLCRAVPRRASPGRSGASPASPAGAATQPAEPAARQPSARLPPARGLGRHAAPSPTPAVGTSGAPRSGGGWRASARPAAADEPGARATDQDRAGDTSQGGHQAHRACLRGGRPLAR